MSSFYSNTYVNRKIKEVLLSERANLMVSSEMQGHSMVKRLKVGGNSTHPLPAVPCFMPLFSSQTTPHCFPTPLHTQRITNSPFM